MSAIIYSSLSYNNGYLLNHGSMLLVGLLYRSVAGLGDLGLISIDLICNEAIFTSALVS